MKRDEGNGRSSDWLSVLADSVADGTPVDWEQQEREHPEFVEKLRMLRDIQSVGRICSSGEAVVEPSRPRSRAVRPGPGLDSQRSLPHRSAESAQPTRPHVRPQKNEDLVPHLSSWGHLSFLEKIGEGSFGEVYRAYDSALDKEVALKLLRSDRVVGNPSPERLLKEARSLAQVEHANVVTVHGADVHHGVVGIWTDLVHGRTLEECLECSGAFGANEAALIGIELCAALSAIHAAGFVHGDVKTTNVMREDGGRIVLMDFGTVRREVPDVFSETGAQGTPLAMAPELLLDEARPSPASDVYSLGVLLYRLVTQEFPVDARSMKELTEKHRQGTPTRLRDRRPDVAPLFARVVDKALSPRPQDRYTTFGGMERALCEAVCVQPTVHKSLIRWRKAARVLAACAVIAGIGFAAKLLLPEPALRVRATFYKQQSQVDAIVDSSTPIKLRAGDSLFMKFESAEDVHLYVLNESAEQLGTVYALFPSIAAFSDNPITAGIAHRLPEDPQQYWEFDGGSSEKVLIVASRSPREVIEKRIANEFHAVSHPELLRAANEVAGQTKVAAESGGASMRIAGETQPASTGESAGDASNDTNSDTETTDVSQLVLDPEKVDAMGLRRLRVSTIDPTRTSALEALAARIQEEMKTSKDVWCQMVRIEP